MPGYALGVDRNGPKLQATGREREFDTAGQSRIAGKDMSMVELADALSNVLHHPVADKTGIPGRFDIEVLWSPDEREPLTLKPGTMAPFEERSRLSASDSSGSGIFTALRGQLGLKLEVANGSVEVLVVERAEKPSGNWQSFVELSEKPCPTRLNLW